MSCRGGGYGRPDAAAPTGGRVFASGAGHRTHRMAMDGGATPLAAGPLAGPGRLEWMLVEAAHRLRVEPAAALAGSAPSRRCTSTPGAKRPAGQHRRRRGDRRGSFALPPLSVVELPVVRRWPRLPWLLPPHGTAADLPIVDAPCRCCSRCRPCIAGAGAPRHTGRFRRARLRRRQSAFRLWRGAFRNPARPTIWRPPGRLAVRRAIRPPRKPPGGFRRRLPAGQAGLVGDGRPRRKASSASTAKPTDASSPSRAAAARAAGWHIECPKDFRHRVLVADDWHVDIPMPTTTANGAAGGWSEPSLGIEVEGRRIDLAPMLHAVFRQDPRWLDRRQLDAIRDDARVIVQPDDGERWRCRPGASSPSRARWSISSTARRQRCVSRFDAPRSPRPLPTPRRRLAGRRQARLDGWLERIRGAEKTSAVAAARLCARSAALPARRSGLAAAPARAWPRRHPRRRHGPPGKTAQTLAHLLTEKHAGRLDKPALVVLPTRWCSTGSARPNALRPRCASSACAAAPAPRPSRRYPSTMCASPPTRCCGATANSFSAAHAYHSLILDEAQTVKNAASQAAQVVRTLTAEASPVPHRHTARKSPRRTVEPVRLPAAWLSRRRQDFAARWRSPSRNAATWCAARSSPAALPPSSCAGAGAGCKGTAAKTIVVRSVELEGRQRDLYETVRATMDAASATRSPTAALRAARS